MQSQATIPGETVHGRLLKLRNGKGHFFKPARVSQWNSKVCWINGKAYGIDVIPEMGKLARSRLERKGLTERVGLYTSDAK